MARTPKRLHGPAQLTNVAATKYTVPASTKTIVRHIRFFNGSASAVTVTLSIGADAAGTRIFDAFTLAAREQYDHYCYHVMEAAEIIQALAGTASAVTLTVNGDELTLG